MGGKEMARSSLIMIIMLALFSLAGCKAVEYVPVESVHTDTVYSSSVKWDSIYVQDSVYVREKGETILINKTKYKYIERYLYDTIYQSRVDSIQVPYVVEKKLTKWQKLKMDIGGFAMSALAVLLVVAGVWLVRKLKL